MAKQQNQNFLKLNKYPANELNERRREFNTPTTYILEYMVSILAEIYITSIYDKNRNLCEIRHISYVCWFWGPPSLIFNGTGKAAGSEVNYSPPFNVEIKECSYTTDLSICPHCVYRQIYLSFPLLCQLVLSVTNRVVCIHLLFENKYHVA
jgi:hypothetical protein